MATSGGAAHSTPSIIELYSKICDNGGKGRPNLSAFIIRLTDASFKSLNEAVEEAKREKSKKSGFIEVQTSGGHEGTISFDGSDGKTHNFTMLDMQRDLGSSGQLESIAETVKGNPGTMQSIGSITKRLNISATTRDTFEMTKQKAKLADEEMRKNSAKVLKGPTGGASAHKKILDKISKARTSTLQRPLTPLSHVLPNPPPIAGKRPPPVKRPINAVAPTVNGEPPKRPKMIAFVKAKTQEESQVNGLGPSNNFERLYPPIRSVDERRRYKEAFDRDYVVYIDTYDRLRTFGTEFQKLGEQLKAAPKSTAERLEVEKDILTKYREFETNPETKRLRRLHEELKQKLNIIKSRVKEFDERIAMG